jgi:hypothetical protein
MLTERPSTTVDDGDESTDGGRGHGGAWMPPELAEAKPTNGPRDARPDDQSGARWAMTPAIWPERAPRTSRTSRRAGPRGSARSVRTLVLWGPSAVNFDLFMVLPRPARITLAAKLEFSRNDHHQLLDLPDAHWGAREPVDAGDA